MDLLKVSPLLNRRGETEKPLNKQKEEKMKQAIVSLLLAEDALNTESGPLNNVILNFALAIIESYGAKAAYRSGPVTLIDTGYVVEFSCVEENTTRLWSVRRNHGNRMSVNPAVALDDLITVLCIAQTEHIIGLG